LGQFDIISVTPESGICRESQLAVLYILMKY
jgi:hypothetical protein